LEISTAHRDFSTAQKREASEVRPPFSTSPHAVYCGEIHTQVKIS